MKAKIPGAQPPQAQPQDYAVLFESPAGQLVLQHLTDKFYGSIYVRGGLEAQRETDFRCGRRAVLEFIYGQLDRANAGVELSEEE